MSEVVSLVKNKILSIKLKIIPAIIIIGLTYFESAYSKPYEAKSLFSSPLKWGGFSQEEDCPSSDSFLWTEYTLDQQGVPFCARYFKSHNFDVNKPTVVQLYGDRSLSISKAPYDIKGNTAFEQQQVATRNSKRTGMNHIVLARPGTYGSDGNHRERRKRDEFEMLNAALSLLSKRYELNNINMIGHSGGGTAVAALMTLGRDDLGCLVVTSGAFNLLERAEYIRARKGLTSRPLTDLTGVYQPYDPLQFIDHIPASDSRRLYLVGDSRDNNTLFYFSYLFYKELKKHQHYVELVEAEGLEPFFHDLKDQPWIKIIQECVDK